MSKKLTYEEFLIKAHRIHGEKFIYTDETKDSFNGSHSVIPIVCQKHGVFHIEARRHINEGYGCNKCAIEERALRNRSTLDEFIEKAKLIHGDDYDYSESEYITAKIPIKIKCKKCGNVFFQKPNDHLSGRGCSKCNESHLEREIRNYLTEKNIPFERNKKFEWLGNLEIDFYLTEYNVGIECQGKQHFGLGGWSDKFNFEEQYERDKNKFRLCKENNLLLYYYFPVNIFLENNKIYNSFYKDKLEYIINNNLELDNILYYKKKNK